MTEAAVRLPPFLDGPHSAVSFSSQVCGLSSCRKEHSMPRLASPIQNLKSHYAAVVIGSGYGGAIAASRLARAGQQVCVLERGMEFQPGEYPNTLPEVLNNVQVDTPQAFLGSRTG